MTSLSIDCPKCGHQHELPENSFEGQDSALFQCAACQHVWRHYTRPLTEYEKQLFAVAPKPKSPAQTIDIVRGIRNRSAYQKAIHNYYLDWWILVIAVVLVIVVLFREVGKIPNFAWFYTQIQTHVGRFMDGLSISSIDYNDLIDTTILTSHLQDDGGVSRLTIKAQLDNTSNRDLTLPAVTVEIFDRAASGDAWTLRTSWQHTLDNPHMRAGERRVIEVEGATPTHVLPGSVVLTFTPS